MLVENFERLQRVRVLGLPAPVDGVVEEVLELVRGVAGEEGLEAEVTAADAEHRLPVRELHEDLDRMDP